MSAINAKSVERTIAGVLNDRADDLADQLISVLMDSGDVRSARQLPTEALLDHIPRVVRGIAGYLQTPVNATKWEMADRLAQHARLRREQGYDIEELLAEYERLAQLVTDEASEAVRDHCADADPVEVAGVFARLREVLAQINSTTVATYRTEEIERQHELALRLTDFGRTLAHELKNPLGAAETGTQTLREDDIAQQPETRERLIDAILNSLQRARELVDDIRVLALSEGARAEVEWHAARDIIDTVTADFSGVAEEAGVRIEVLEPVPEIEMPARAAEIALINFVGNAIKYADYDKPDRWARIRVERDGDGNLPHGGNARVAVADNGIGIPEGVRSKMFRRHFRAHPDVAEGTGLGLSIARRAIEQHGGRIDFESKEGAGSTFWFTLPARDSEPDRTAAR